jgi:ribose 5-phosphate isomerase B
VGRREVDRAILVDSVGYGSAMIANRIRVSTQRSARIRSARHARSYSDSNVLCLGAKVIGSGIAAALVET